MAITREIEGSSEYFEGSAETAWELLGIKQNTKCNTYYYKDAQGGYHHTSVRREKTYSPYEVKVREEDGAMWARVVNKKTGQAIHR